MLIDMIADTQGQVSFPSDVVPQVKMLLTVLCPSRCDEARPECTVRQTCPNFFGGEYIELRCLTISVQPCSRLGHPCDYNPRLSFKDDTPRVIEKMAGVVGSGWPVWDRMLLLSHYSLKLKLSSISSTTIQASTHMPSTRRFAPSIFDFD